MNITKTAVKNAFLIGSILFTFTACEKEGPAERVGKKIDNAVEKAQEKAGEAAETVKKKAIEVKNKIKEEVKEHSDSNP